MRPTRNLKYLAWIRTQPCLVCGRTGGIEAAHTGPHGVGQKSPDTSAIPLCAQEVSFVEYATGDEITRAHQYITAQGEIGASGAPDVAPK
jgi:hypothetical protein